MNEKDDVIAEAIEEEELDTAEDDVPGGESEEYEYDEDGNIIIPEVIGDDEDDGDEPADVEDGEDDEGDGEELADAEAPDGEERKEGDREEEPPAPQTDTPPTADEKDAEIARLRRELAARDRVAKDALEKLGVESKDPQTGLASIAAEAEGLSTEEYLKRQQEQAENEEARRFMRRARFEERMRADLARIHAAYPETKKYTSPEEFPNFKRFGELVDAGNTPEEAYIASHPGSSAERVAAAVRQSSLNHTKDHLRSAVPKGSKDNGPRMTRAELESWRDLFPGKSDKEIVALYKKTARKES